MCGILVLQHCGHLPIQGEEAGLVIDVPFGAVVLDEEGLWWTLTGLVWATLGSWTINRMLESAEVIRVEGPGTPVRQGSI